MNVPKNEKLLKDAGWVVNCQSPYELSHPDGSVATGNAAICVIACLREEWIEEHKDMKEGCTVDGWAKRCCKNNGGMV